MSTPSPTTPGGAPSSATSPGAAALPLRIDTQKTWSRINTWLSTTAAAAAGAKGTEAKRLLGLAKDVWEQPGQAVPLVLQACQLAGLEPVDGDDLVVAQPAPTTTAPAWTPPANPPARKLAPTTTTAPPTPTWTPAQPAQPAPTTSPFWQRLAGAAAIMVAIAAAALCGAVVGVTNVALAAAGGLGGLTIAIAVAAIRRGGLGAVAAAGGLVVATGGGVTALVGGHVHATGGGVAALLAGGAIAALVAGGDQLIISARVAMDKGGAQRPQR